MVDESGAIAEGGFQAHGENTRACDTDREGKVMVTCCANENEGAKIWMTPGAAKLARQRADEERMARMRAAIQEQEAKKAAAQEKAAAKEKAKEEKAKRKKEQ